MTYCPLYRHHDGSSPDSSEGAGRMGVTAGMNRAGGWLESGDVPAALTGKAATHKALPSCKEKAVSGFKSRPAHWLADYRRDTMNRKRCPDCGTFDTERVHTEWFTDMLEEIRICNECPAQFTNKYSMFEQTLEDELA